MGIPVDVTRDLSSSVTAGYPVEVQNGAVPRVGLGAVAGVAGPGLILVPDPGEGWPLIGVDFVGVGCGGSRSTKVSCDDPDVGYSSLEVLDTVSASIASIVTAVSCGTFSLRNNDFPSTVLRVARNQQWQLFARELWDGAVQQSRGLTAGWLADGTAIDVTSGSAESVGDGSVVDLCDAVRLLVDAWAACGDGSDLVLHVPLWAIDVLGAQGLIVQGEVPGRWRTYSGVLVVADSGYSGNGYMRPAGGSEVTFYATSPIYGVLSDPVVDMAQFPHVNRDYVEATSVFGFGWFCCHLSVRVRVC